MKVPLSELMEIGIENTDPTVGAKGTHNLLETKTACAIGAAQFTVQAEKVEVGAGDLYDLLSRDIDEPPLKGNSLTGSLYGCLWRLNDIEKMSREAICEWVRSIEDKYDLYLQVENESSPTQKQKPTLA